VDSILILDDNLKLKYTIHTPRLQAYSTSFLIADVDNNGFGEIVATMMNKHLICYAFDPATKQWQEKWISDSPFNPLTTGNTFYPSLIIADINNDGHAEILAVDKIYDAETGKELATLPEGGRGYSTGGMDTYMPVVADIVGDPGLEIVAGNTVYEVNLTNRNGTAGNTVTKITEMNAIDFPDGFTSIADIDNDGDLDIVVTTAGSAANTAMIYAWDGATATQIGQTITVTSNNNRISRATIGDINGDKEPEIAFTYCDTIMAIAYKIGIFTQLFKLKMDDASGATSIVMFDFNQDGEVELVHRDAEKLRIYDKNGNVLNSFDCLSDTHTEYPVIVDLNKDGQADILVSGKTDGYNDVRIIRYGAKNGHWAPARNVWNQHSYCAVNIKNNLTVPKFRIRQTVVFAGADGILGTADDIRPYNNFLQQQTLLNNDGIPVWLSPDILFASAPTFYYHAAGDSLVITVPIKNIGDAAMLSPIYIAAYQNSADPANWLASGSIVSNIGICVGETVNGKIVIKNYSTYTSINDIVIRINDNGKATYIQQECDYTNNENSQPTPSTLMANDDYVTTFECKSVEVDVLANDEIRQMPTTQGKDFWLSFGQNRQSAATDVTLQVKIVARQASDVTFTYGNNTSTTNTVNIPAGTVYTLTLDNTQKQAVYNTSTGEVSDKSLHIESTADISVYALNQSSSVTDATNVLPVNALGENYYHLSYKSNGSTDAGKDGMVLIATENTTTINVNGTNVNLNKGQVYYKTDIDMTGQYITSNKPIAHFVSHHGAFIPDNTHSNADIIFQQMLPVESLGTKFLVPVSVQGETRIRVLASQSGTVINPNGGTIVTTTGSANSLNLDAGQFVELSVSAQTGCFITSNYPVAVCSYLLSYTNAALGSTIGGPAEAWIPPVEQSVGAITIAPFLINEDTKITNHYAMIVVPTDKKQNTQMATGSAGFVDISGGTWHDNSGSGYSYYSLALTDATSSYSFVNISGLTVLVYGLGAAESYYYLAGSSVSDLSNTQGSTPTVTLLSNPAHGTAVVNNSKVVYTNTSCSGAILDEFTYRVCLAGDCDDAKVIVLVRAMPSIILEEECSFSPTLLVDRRYAGAIYEWQYKTSATGSNWAAVSGGNTHELKTIEQGKYRVKITCFGQEVFTNEITFAITEQTYISQLKKTSYTVRIEN
jgi:hypothetical protein